jgi:hypothetical protein
MTRADIEHALAAISEQYIEAHLLGKHERAAAFAYALGACGITNEEWNELQRRKVELQREE